MKKRSEADGATKTEEPLTLLIRAVAAEYPNDPSGAGVVIAFLTSGEYYVAIMRYTQKWGEGKKMVCSAKAKSLEEAVASVSHNWLGNRNAKRQLGRALGIDDHEYEGINRPDGA